MEKKFIVGNQKSWKLVKADKNTLQPGDHIFAFRFGGLYSHHGIYVGNGEVIHFNTTQAALALALGIQNPNIPFYEEDDIPKSEPCGRCGYSSSSSSKGLGIVKCCVDCFGSKIYLYKYGVSWIEVLVTIHGTCCPYESKSLQEGVNTAYDKLKTGFGEYSLFTNNCEHFATFCRTGKKFSGQLIPGTGDKVQQLPVGEIEKIASGTCVNVNVM